MVPSPHEINLIAASAVTSPSTVRRVFSGGGNAYSRKRVRDACMTLGLPLPPEPQKVAS